MSLAMSMPVPQSTTTNLREARVRAYVERLRLPDGITRYVSNRRLTRTDQRIVVAMFVLDTMLAVEATMSVVGGSSTAKRVIVSREEVTELLSKARQPWKLTGTEMTQALRDLVDAGEVRPAGILFVFGGSPT